MLITDPDNTVHFSSLKAMARSAQHYVHACRTPREATRDMRVGSAVNQLVLGRSPRHPIVVWPGETRRDKGYKAWAADQRNAEILTEPEWADAQPIAEAVKRDPVATRLLAATDFEVPLSWTDNGIPCSTTGVDIVGVNYLADLKVVHNAEPEYLQKHAIRMLWHAQLAWYRNGADSARGQAWTKDLFLLCVEAGPPHCVTVLHLAPDVVEHGDRCVRAWMERLKVCADSDAWSGYAQSVVEFALPEWMGEEVEDE